MYVYFKALWYFKALNLRYGTEGTLITYMDCDILYKEYIANLCSIEHYFSFVMTRSVWLLGLQ